MVPAIVLAALGGLIIGSFLNVVAWRLPRGESLSHPRSRCPACDAPVKPYDNIPVLSWLLLRGRCRGCGEPISRALPARRGRRPPALYVRGRRADVGRRRGDRAGARARHAPRADRAHRPRPPDHPQQAHRARRRARARASAPSLDPAYLRRAADRRRRRRRLLPAARAGLPEGHGHGRRQARRASSGCTSGAPSRRRSSSR